MPRQSTVVLLYVGALGFAVSSLWHLSTFLPFDHSMLESLDLVLILVAAISLAGGVLKLFPYYRRLKWLPGDLLVVVRRHGSGRFAALCLACVLYAALVMDPTALGSKSGLPRNSTSRSGLDDSIGHSVDLSEDALRMFTARRQRTWSAGLVALHSVGVLLLHIADKEEQMRTQMPRQQDDEPVVDGAQRP